jgi:hypothetical protein
MPGWKQEFGRRLDALLEAALPDVRKAVRWNSPFYGADGLGWFLGFHCLTRYVKVTFFNGSSLDPLPPEASQDARTRYLHIHEGEAIDEERPKNWIRQMSALTGWEGF